MMGSDKLWASLLNLQAPWTVRNITLEETGRRLDIGVGLEMPRSWLGLGRRSPAEETERVWRHVNIDGWQCHLHVFLPPGTPPLRHAWVGEEDSPFTRGMSRHIFNLLKEGMSFESICKLLGVRFNDLWKFKFALDNGQASPPPTEASPEEETGEADGNIPDSAHPVWQALVNGDFDPEIRVLSLKLLLSRTRSQLGAIQDSEVKALKLKELQRYFVKNQRMLGHELTRMRNLT